MKCSLLAGLIGGALAFSQLQRRVDEEVRRRIEAVLATHYARHSPTLSVTVRSAELVQGKGMIARGIKVVDRAAPESEGEIVHIEEMRLSCRTELEELIKGDPQVTHVLLRRPTIRAVRRADGSWSTASLLPLPEREPSPREIKVENGTVEVVDHAPTSIVFRDVNLELTEPTEEERKAAAAAFAQSGRAGSASPDAASSVFALNAAASRTRRHFRGSFTGDHARQVRIEGFVDSQRPEWAVSGEAATLEIAPEWREALPEELASPLRALGSLRAEAKVRFRIERDPAAAAPWRFTASGTVEQGRFDDPRWPRPLTDIRAGFEVTHEGAVIRNLTARSGQTSVRLSGRRSGFHAESPVRLAVEVEDLELDQTLLDVLPESLRGQWLKYRPAGQIDAVLGLTFDGREWRPEIVVQCRSVAFAHYAFPYRLEHGTGRVELKDDRLTIQLVAFGGNRQVRIDGDIRQPLGRPTGSIDVSAAEVPLDEKLLAAMPKEAGEVVRSLEPRGVIDVTGRVWCDSPDEGFHRRFVIDVKRGAIRYRRFPYPIGNIRGTIEVNDAHWAFRNFTGTNDTGVITCSGELQSPAQGGELQLHLAAKSLPIEEELRDALPIHMQQVWNDFRPNGTIDLPRVFVAFQPSDKRLSVEVRAEPVSESTSIQPVYFPYRLDRLRGVLEYRDGRITLNNLRAEHGNVRTSAEGLCTFHPDGSWRFELKNLHVDRLRFDRELLPTLPGPFRKTIAAINPTGPVNLCGTLALARSGLPDAPLTSFWDIDVDFQQGAIDFGAKFDQMHGVARLIGEYDGSSFRCRGELSVDSLRYKELQITGIEGPFWIDNDRILFGTWVEQAVAGGDPGAQKQVPRTMTATLFNGKIQWDARVLLGASPRYRFQASYHDGDLARCAQELIPGRQNLSGKIRMEIDVGGTGRSLNNLTGRGKAMLYDANIYELPAMVSLLKILSIRAPDRNGFSTSDIDFNIQGEHILCERIVFSGDAISLQGKGELTLPSTDLRMQFHALVGRAENTIPLVSDILGGASQQIMQLNVGGTLQNPDITREAFPGVSQALQQLQGDRANSGGGPDARVRPTALERALPRKQ